MTKSPNETETVVPLGASGTSNYLLAPHRGQTARAAGLQPMSLDMFSRTVQLLNLDVVRVIKRDEKVQTMSVGGGASIEDNTVVVTRMTPERAELMRTTLPVNLILTEDKFLDYADATPRTGSAPGVMPQFLGSAGNKRPIAIRIVGDNDAPLANITVQLTGDGYPSAGQTNADGNVVLDLVTLGNRPARSIFVAPVPGYWDFYQANPQINESAVNLIRLRSLTASMEGFPQKFNFGWGQRVMGLDRLPAEVNGKGVRIAIIDSGCDNTHPLLQHIQHGQDFAGSDNGGDWNKDVVGHGTHCAGVIGARPTASIPWRGFAPGAEIHILRIFPGGQFSSLLDALDYCITHQIDVVNMSLGGGTQVDPVVDQRLEDAVQQGITCIVAAGNSGDAVKYPAASQWSFAVAAIGNASYLQQNTWDGTTIQNGLITPDGFFSPNFTCFGPQIRVCAPGVGIVSTVPGNAFQPESGTSMAAPHVTGLAALLLAHHPIFQTQFQTRNVQRVQALVSLVQSIASSYANTLTPDRTGAGMPNLQALADILLHSVQQPDAQPSQPAASVSLAASQQRNWPSTLITVPNGSNPSAGSMPGGSGQLAPQNVLGNIFEKFSPSPSVAPLQAGPQTQHQLDPGGLLGNILASLATAAGNGFGGNTGRATGAMGQIGGNVLPFQAGPQPQSIDQQTQHLIGNVYSGLPYGGWIDPYTGNVYAPNYWRRC